MSDKLENLKAIFEKVVYDAVCNFLFRVSCQVNDTSTSASSPGEALAKRCFKLLQQCLKPYCWPDAELRINWLDKLFLMLDQANNTNFANVTMALDILAWLCTVRSKQDLSGMLKTLQRGIITCINCSNAKVNKAAHALLGKLLAIFPIESGPQGNKMEELDTLCTSIGSSINQGLVSYESTTASTSLYGPIMLLKAACATSPNYLDKYLINFMKAIQKMQKEHVSAQQPTTGESAGNLTELLITSLELAKSRLSGMHGDMRKVFLTILTTLIEKSPDVKLLKAMIKIVDEWVRTKTVRMHVCL